MLYLFKKKCYTHDPNVEGLILREIACFLVYYNLRSQFEVALLSGSET